MPRPSSIDQLPEEIRVEIGRLRSLGWTIDQILEHLRGLLDRAPSRSALGRHIQGLDKLGERMRRSRQVAEAVVRELGTAPESQAARLNIELIHTAILDLFMHADEGGEGEPGEGGVPRDPIDIQWLAKAVDHLAKASKTNVEFIRDVEQRAAEKARRQALTEAADTAAAAATEAGLSADRAAQLRRDVLGLRPIPPSGGAT